MSASTVYGSLGEVAVPEKVMETGLALDYYRLQVVADESIHLPGFAGAMLRGALGHALRELSCMTGQAECVGCPLLNNCRYPTLFEPKLLEVADVRYPTPPPPYVMRSPVGEPRTYLPSETFAFEMVLFGLTAADVELILRAWQRALWKGLGTRKGRARLIAVEQHRQGQWFELSQPSGGQWLAQPPCLMTIPEPPSKLSSLTLRFLSPVRFQHRGRLCLPDQLTPAIVTGALKRRLQNLAVSLAPPTMPEANSLCLTSDLQRYRWERQSSRQGRNIRLDGLLGDVHLTGPNLADWWPWLWLGQFTHLGKNVSHGMGQYQILLS